MPLFDTLTNLAGRRALITGATGSLGLNIAHTLAQLGAEILLLDKPEAPLATVANEIKALWSVNAVTYECDLEMQEQRETVLQAIKDSSQLDILINNAAFVGSSDLEGWAVPFEKQSIETWRRALEVNLVAPFHICQALAPLLRQSPSGCIINICSIYAVFGPDLRLYEGTTMGNPAAYAASKGGLLALTRWLATTLAPRIRVNAISPGGIARGQSDQFTKRYTARTPLGRMATEDDLSGIVAFLASDLSSYITGQNYLIDGGWSAW
jgi:NAD(P)-dependent dehydrogenase (short-subunit alcohol dehydrogenase family)